MARGRVPVEDLIVERLDRRAWPLVVTPLFVLTGILYVFRWGSVVRHSRSMWLVPGDLWRTYLASSEFAHGHFGAVYSSRLGFLALPGMLLLLAPVGALSGSFHTTAIEITRSAHPRVFLFQTSQPYPNTPSTALQIGSAHPAQFWLHPQWLVPLVLVALAASCTLLFASDALAERLQVPRSRRGLLAVVEGALLFNVTVLWGHPEDAVAVALAIYAFLAAADDRFARSGWLFGAAFAFQPLVIVVLPILLVMGGAQRLLGLLVRAALPGAVLVAPSLLANFSATVHSTVVQPTYPYAGGNHKTPLFGFAPTTGGRGTFVTVGGGPLRVAVLVVAGVLALPARRWRQRPELLAWAMAFALALRVLTEPVMTSYYTWPPLAVAVIVAARAHLSRFAVAVAVAVLGTVVAQWRIGEYWWWALALAAVAGTLVAAARLLPLAADYEPETRRRAVPVTPSRSRAADLSRKKRQARKKASRTRKRNARR